MNGITTENEQCNHTNNSLFVFFLVYTENRGMGWTMAQQIFIIMSIIVSSSTLTFIYNKNNYIGIF